MREKKTQIVKRHFGRVFFFFFPQCLCDCKKKEQWRLVVAPKGITPRKIAKRHLAAWVWCALPPNRLAGRPDEICLAFFGVPVKISSTRGAAGNAPPPSPQKRHKAQYQRERKKERANANKREKKSRQVECDGWSKSVVVVAACVLYCPFGPFFLFSLYCLVEFLAPFLGFMQGKKRNCDPSREKSILFFCRSSFSCKKKHADHKATVRTKSTWRGTSFFSILVRHLIGDWIMQFANRPRPRGPPSRWRQGESKRPHTHTTAPCLFLPLGFPFGLGFLCGSHPVVYFSVLSVVGCREREGDKNLEKTRKKGRKTTRAGKKL